MSRFGRNDGVRRYLSGGVVSLLGAGFLLVPAYDIWDDATNLSWELTTTLAENALFLLLAFGLLSSGVWLVKSDWKTKYVTLVGKRTLLATFVVGFPIGWAVFLQITVMGAIKPYVIALDGILVGAVTSFALSVASTRTAIRDAEVDETRARNQRLELLYAAANELEDATSHEEAYDVIANAFAVAFSNPSYRVRVNDEVVIDERQTPVTDEPTETVPIGGRGEIELWDATAEHSAILTVELFASYIDETIQRIERESRLRKERDILEFINRTLRHDLMGDVSLLQGRLRMLDRNVTFSDDTSAEHLQVALNRTVEVEEFVRTMRTYMESVLNENDTLEATSLGPVLEEHVEKLRATHPELSVQCSDIPEVAVEADDLIDRVFENLLTNAVEHNDAQSPEITVELDRHGNVVTVEIADNGPGIPENRRRSIFEKGERGTESDGTGFGLYLVKDIVESYGGEIRVRDNDPRGAVFELDLPVADETE